MANTVLIVGYGTVGKNVHHHLFDTEPYIYDKYKKDYPQSIREKPDKYDFAFICVDTPLMPNSTDLDVSEVINAIQENDAEIYIVKSTIPVGTIDQLTSVFPAKKIVYSPEYYGGTPHCNNFTFDFTILGGEKQTCLDVQQFLQNYFDARHIFRITDSRTAELVKFMENSWIATKVSFCSQFYAIAEAEGLDYEDLRELFILDPRVNPSHTFIYKNHPYWDSHCLNKDVPHIANAYGCAELLRDVIKFNGIQKEGLL